MKHIQDFFIYCFSYLVLCLTLDYAVDIGQMLIISSIVTVVFYAINRAYKVFEK